MIRSLEDCQKRYGVIDESKWLDEARWCGFFDLPVGISLLNSATGMAMTRIYCNRDMGTALIYALADVVSQNLAHELHYFDGCLMVRDVRGEPGKPSTHSYALAVDFNAKALPLGSDLRFSDAFVACFTKRGFAYGGDFSRKDPMHFSYAWE